MKILIIEDSPEYQLYITKRLEKICPDLLIKRVSLLKQAEEEISHESFDLIFLDKMLPDCVSDEMILEFIEKYKRHKIVVMTGDDRSESIYQSLKAGALDFLPKSDILRDEELERILMYAGKNVAH